MYEYRNLTPAEQKEIVRFRIDRGYPQHAPPHPFRGEGYYFITAVNYEHNHVMNSATRRTEFELSLLDKFQEIDTKLDGWIILTNHYHFVAKLKTLDLVSKQLERLHGSTSYKWNIEDNMTKKRKVWYRFTDCKIRNEQHYYAALNYIHHNSVKHGYCEHANDWPWSSVHLYLQDYGKEWLVEKWKKFEPSENYGRGWDD